MEWTRGPIIGRGSSASVSLATNTTGELFAIKSTDLSSSTSLQKEQHLISQLCSSYIIKYLGSDITYNGNSSMYNLFLEYVPGGTLSDLIKTQGCSLKENEIQFYAHQILQGLNYIHLEGIVHCDIKGQNLLIGKEGLKIADFGCAKLAEDTSTFAGTPAYMAPEVARGEEQSFPADIWAMGCTIIEMATGSNPWPEMKDPASALYRIGYSGDVPDIPSWFSCTGMDFVTKCLMKDPRERWTAGELLQHPFLNSVAGFGKIREVARKSPNSVMDQGFWDVAEESGCFGYPADIVSSSDSLAGRIRGLIGDDVISNLNLPDWRDDEDWMTVRGNEIEEFSEQHFDFDDLIEEEIQTSIVIDDSLFDSYIDESSIINHELSSVLVSEMCVQDVYVFDDEITKFEEKLMELYFLLNQILYLFKLIQPLLGKHYYGKICVLVIFFYYLPYRYYMISLSVVITKINYHTIINRSTAKFVKTRQ